MCYNANICIRPESFQWLLIRLWCIPFLIPVYGAYAETPVNTDTHIEEIKQTVLEWADSLKTFSGRYRLDLFQEDGTPSKQYRCVLRWDGMNTYYELESGDPDASNIEIFAYHNGLLDTYIMQQGRSSYGISGSVGKQGVPIPWGVHITPEEIFGQNHEYSLAYILSQGVTQLIERDGQWILWHSNPELSCSVDVYVDKQYRVTRLEQVRRPYSYSVEQLQEIFPGDPFDLRVPRTTLILSAYSDFDGVPFPIEVTKIWWQLDEYTAENINSAYEAGAISLEQYIVDMYSVPVYELARQIFRLDDARVNLALTETDFQIEWPKGTRIYTPEELANMEETGLAITAFVPSPNPYSIAVVVGVISILGLITAFVLLKQRNKESKLN